MCAPGSGCEAQGSGLGTRDSGLRVRGCVSVRQEIGQNASTRPGKATPQRVTEKTGLLRQANHLRPFRARKTIRDRSPEKPEGRRARQAIGQNTCTHAGHARRSETGRPKNRKAARPASDRATRLHRLRNAPLPLLAGDTVGTLQRFADPTHLRQCLGALPAREDLLRLEPFETPHEPFDGLHQRQ